MEQNIKLKLERPWDEVRERIKETELSLSDDDLRLETGQEGKLLDHLSKKLNKSPEAVKDWIESISSNTAQAG